MSSERTSCLRWSFCSSSAILPILVVAGASGAGFEGGRAVLEELLLPAVEHRGVDAVLVTQIRDGDVFEEMKPKDGDLLLGGESLASLLGHGRTSARNCSLFERTVCPISTEAKHDDQADKAKRREALLFFVHFIEDLHQPLHVGDNNDRGGNQLQVRFVALRRGTNLHKVWDVNVIEYADLGEAAWVTQLNDLADEPENQDWTEGTPIDWADESLKYAKQAYQLPGRKEEIGPGERLNDAYADFALSIIQRRLAQAGVRLAHELNRVFE